MEFIKYLENYLPLEERKKLEESLSFGNVHAILLNTTKMSEETLLTLFPHIKKHPIVPNGYIYNKNEYELGKSIYHELGCFYIQEPSAMLVSYLLNPKPNDLVLDMCAAPGGKTIGASLLMDNKGLIIANDLSRERTRALADNVARLGRANVIVTNNNFSLIYQNYLNTFDKIILDAPCSGSGMFRKDEKMIFDWSINKVFRFATEQMKLIEIAYNMLKPGGTLVYSTCSYSYEEDEQVIKHLLSVSDASIVEIENNPSYYVSKDKLGIHLFPYKFEGEGHYICLINKPGESTNTTYHKNKALSYLLPKEIKDYSSNKFGDYLFAIPGEINYKKLNIIQYGIKVGEIFKKEIVYDYHLAHVLSNYEQRIELNENELLSYLKGEQINKVNSFKGNVLLTYKNIPIDFGKTNGTIIKNHYPKYLRKSLKIQ